MIATMPPPVAIEAPAPVPGDEGAILAAMADSAAGWDTGDLRRFMAVYAEDAVYVTGKGLVRGRAAIADTYAKSFAGGGNARGKLRFTNTAFRRLDPAHLLLWARWSLTPAGEGAKVETGMTSLIFERRRGGWRIVADHSS